LPVGTLTAAASGAFTRDSVASPTVLPVPLVPLPTPIKYTVQEGDTLFDIALHYGVTLEAIAAANKLDNPELIRPDQVLVIPTSSARPRATAVTAITPDPNRPLFTHVIETGDTLFDIALRYGVTIESIVTANDISNPEYIRPGQKLVIPSQAAARAPATRTPRPIGVVTPLPTPVAATVNGLPLSAFVVVPGGVRQNVRAIYAKGQSFGRNPRVFAKVGDSTVENGFFFAGFDQGNYALGVYAYLQAVLDQYAGSFGRGSVAVGVGYHTTTVMDTAQTNPACRPGETLFECELRLTNPSVVIIRLGANDVGMPDTFERVMRRMVDQALNLGIIPVLGTKADRQDAGNVVNTIIRQIAADYMIPLWDFDVVAQTMPNRGLAADNVHPTVSFSRDYARAETFQVGHAMQDLTALMTLDAVWRAATQR
jgi:LysM repeat protein